MSAGDPLPRLHLVTSDDILQRPEFPAWAEELLEVGGERLALHLRGPRVAGAALYRLAERLANVATRADALFLVNDRVDVALAVNAGGVQLGGRGLDPEDARRLLGERPRLGVSVHSPDEAEAALRRGADFLLAGTLYPSASHPRAGGSGVEWLRRVPAAGGRLIGIGGVTPERVGEVLEAGAHGVAVISAIWNAERPREALLRFIRELYER